MIVIFVLQVAVSFFFDVIGVFPTIEVPAFFDGGGALITGAAELGAAASGMGAWVPFGAMVPGVAAIIASAVFMVAAWTVRWVISLVSLGHYGTEV